MSGALGGRWLARGALVSAYAAALVAWQGCSGCDTRPAPDGAASTSASAVTVNLAPTVASRALGRWPEEARAVASSAAHELLPPDEGARVELRDAGLEPRAVRRHALEAAKERTFACEIDLAMKVVQDEETTIPPVPALTVRVGVQTSAVDGEIAEVRVAIEGADVRSRGDADEDVVRQLAPLVKKLPGVSGTLRVTSQGVRGHAPAPPPTTPPELHQLWTSVAEAMSDAVVTFPAEPIGAGARWDVIDRQRRAGVTMLRKTEMTLLDITDGDLRLGGRVVEAAIAGTAQDPALPKEVALEVLEGVAVGKRRHTLRGTELWPLAAETELSSDLRLQATATAKGYTDTRTSQVNLTQILRCVRTDADAGG